MNEHLGRCPVVRKPKLRHDFLEPVKATVDNMLSLQRIQVQQLGSREICDNKPPRDNFGVQMQWLLLVGPWQLHLEAPGPALQYVTVFLRHHIIPSWSVEGDAMTPATDLN